MKIVEQTSKLATIAAAILQKHNECETLIGSIQAKGRDACVLAWEIGGLLRKAKNELKGGFTKWREDLPGLSSATTSRYLALANRLPSRQDLEDALGEGVSLTDLYREVRILPEKDETEGDPGKGEKNKRSEQKSSSPGKRGRPKFTASLFISNLKSVVEKVAKLHEKAPVSQWTPEEREGFRKAFTELKAIAEELDELPQDTRRPIADELGAGTSKPQPDLAAA
jgi:hypothetical protein